MMLVLMVVVLNQYYLWELWCWCSLVTVMVKRQMQGISLIGGENVLTFDILQSPLLILMHFPSSWSFTGSSGKQGFEKKTKIAFLWLFSLILFQLISSKVKEDRGQVEQIIYIFAQCLFHICWEPNSYLLRNKFVLVVKQIPCHLSALIYER